MNTDATDVDADALDLRRMETSADRKLGSAGGVTDGHGATDGARWAVEGRQHPIAGGLDLAAPILAQDAPRLFVVPVKEGPPGLIAHGGGALRGADDVREEHG